MLIEASSGGGHTWQRLPRKGQGLWEVRRRKDNKSLRVVLYFFLLRDAPRGPSVLIGSGERSCAGRADVNRPPRSSAAGTNIHSSLLPFLHPPFFLLHIYLIRAPDLQHLLFCGSFFPRNVSARYFLLLPSRFPVATTAQNPVSFAHAQGSAEIAPALETHTSTNAICAYLLRGNTALCTWCVLINSQNH